MKKIITILTVLAIATGAVCYLNFRNTDNSEKTNTQTSSQNQTGQNDKTDNQSSDTKTYPVKYISRNMTNQIMILLRYLQ